jgi:hypothetical protein
MSVRIYCNFQCDTPGCDAVASQEKPMPPPADWGMDINADRRIEHYCPACWTKRVTSDEAAD